MIAQNNSSGKNMV
jgi:hypothetical protein